jgi:hypothetical protein
MRNNSFGQTADSRLRRLTAYKSIFAFGILATLVFAFVFAPLAADRVSAQETRATAIDRVEPRNIPANVGGTLSVYGSGFTADSVIRLRGYGLLVTTFVNTGALTGQIPTTIPAGSYNVEVRDPSGNSEWDRQINIVAPPPPTNEPQQPIPTQEPQIIPTNEPAPIPSPPPGEPRLTARGYTVTPTTIKPGDPLAVTFELVNLGNRTAQSIIASLDPAGKFLPSGGIAALTVPDINPGGTFLVSLSAIGALDLPAGPAVIPIKLTYRDFQGETFESNVSFSVNVEAVTTSTQLTISEYITEPDPVVPGSPVLVQIVVTNSGTVPAPQALLRISGADSVLLAGPQGDSFPLGNLAPGDSVSVNAELVVRADATAGPQAQPYTLSYLQGTELKEFTGTLTLDVAEVQAPEPLLLLEEYELSESDLKPGDRFTLTATLANVGTGPVNNLLATFGSVTDDSGGGTDGGTGGTTTTPSTTFAPLGTGGSIFVGTLTPDGDSATLEQSFIVSGSAKSGVYTLPITLRYPNSKREIVTTSLSISVIVVAPPELQFVDAPLPPEAFIGEPQTISIAFTNIGARDVAFRSAEVTAENAEVMDGAEVFIGTVKAGEEGSMMATVMPSGEGPVTVTVNLHYIDELNQPRTLVRTYETVAVEMPPMPTDDPSMFPPEETPVPEPDPEPTFADVLGKGLLGLLGLGS